MKNVSSILNAPLSGFLMAENFIAEAFSLLAISLVVIVLRWISRVMTVGFSKLAADDYLMIVAGVSDANSPVPTAYGSEHAG